MGAIGFVLTILSWLALLAIQICSFSLIGYTNVWCSKKFRIDGGNFKHGNSHHLKRLWISGIRNFLMLLVTLLLPTVGLVLTLLNPNLFFLQPIPSIITTDGSVAGILVVLVFVGEQILLGAFGDVLEIFKIDISNAKTNSFSAAISVAVFRLYVSIYSAIFFLNLLNISIDRVFVNLKLWKDPNRPKNLVRVNLSGLSRGYVSY